MGDKGSEKVEHKHHRERHSGRKAEKKKFKNDNFKQQMELPAKQRNPKAFTFNSAIKAERQFRRKQDIDTKKQHIPVVDRTPVEPPPILVAVVGPPKVGKSLLIQCLIKSFTKHPLSSIVGPVTLVSGKRRRITFMECNNDVNSMIDIAKVADLVLLLIDASFGFEMEVFEFLNICQVHGMPRIMGVLTHLDILKNAKQLRKTKKTLKHRFWTEVYAGAKLFYLSGLIHEEYLRMEIKNLARFISVMKFRPLTWRTTHPYLLVDRVEDLTDPELIRQDQKVDRTVSLYGYVRGVPLNKQSSIHIPGCGDLKIKDVSFLSDPCPLPEQLKKRALFERERLLYAPFSGVGGIVYDKDAVYVELGGSHSHKQEDIGLVSNLLQTQETLDHKLEKSELKLFKDSVPIKSQDFDEGTKEKYYEEKVIDSGRIRRKVVFNDPENNLKTIQDSGNEESDEETEEDKDEDFSSRKKLVQVSEVESDNDIENSESDDEDNIYTRKENVIKGKNTDGDDEVSENISEKNLGVCKESSESETSEDESSNVPKKKRKFNNENSKSENHVYHQLSTDKDNMVKNKISEILSSLEKRTRKIETELPNDDESFDELSDGEKMDVDNNEDKFEMVEEDENGDSEDENNQIKWKKNLAQRAKDAFIDRQKTNVSIMKLVYGVFEEQLNEKEEEEEEEEKEPQEDIGGIFKIMKEKQKQKMEEKELKNQEESVFFSKDYPRDWLLNENKIKLVNRFVTGKWKESEDAEELLKLDDIDDDEVYGDFEDLESGEKHEGELKQDNKEELEEKKKLIEKKKKLKEQFDQEYDNTEGKSYYEDLKMEAEKQAELNKSEFYGLADDIRVQLEGFRPGMYVRVEIADVPCELITNLDPSYPMVIGGLLPGEENIGYVQCRIKKHRWYSKILKTKDPLIVSVGWRRFQTLPIFSKLEDNLRSRMLKYTPEHVSCMGHFWGPITPQGTGILAVQDLGRNNPGFRIAATGTIVELDKSSKIVKKLKLTGVPMKIFKKTAFIKDMFNTQLEVAKFEGARVKTVSGIRGQIKKAVSKPEGCFRATFEDKIQLSDIVFCRTWYKVDIPKFYNPVISLLLPPEEKLQWKGMKTTGQLKREHNIKAIPNNDSFYTEVVREPKVFKPLIIPKTLQRDLPYRDKPKLLPILSKRKVKYEDKRVAVVREPKEENVARLMKMIRTNYAHKQEKLKEATHKRITSYQAKLEADASKRMKKQREMKKEIFRELSKIDAKKKK